MGFLMSIFVSILVISLISALLLVAMCVHDKIKYGSWYVNEDSNYHED